MIKQILMISSVMVAAPALAQDATPGAATSSEAVPTQGQTSPGAENTAQDAQTTDQAAAASDARSQIAQLVDSEWSMYDTDSTGVLELGEFSAWMTKLRQQSTPTFDGTTAESQQWFARAFDFADKDDTTTVSKAEFVTLLTPTPAEQAASNETEAGSGETTEQPAS